MKKAAIIFFLICISFDYGQTNDFFSAENRLKFANYLNLKKDYLRASLEYSKYLSIVNNDTVRLKLSDCLFKINRNEEAFDNLQILFFNSDFENESRAYFFKQLAILNRYGDYHKFLKLQIYNDTKFKPNLLKLEQMLFMLDDKPIDKDYLLKEFEKEDKKLIFNFVKRYRNPTLKNPFVASVLSAIIPGAGKIYTKNYGDAITAFLFTAVLGYAAIDNYNAGHKTRSWILGGLAAYFYAGNIYGSYTAAQVYNYKEREKLKFEIKKYVEDENYFLPQFEMMK